MQKGKLKWFNDRKGFGFLINDNGEDVFVHYSQIKKDGFKTLKEDNIIEYDEIVTDKGLQAQNVTIFLNSTNNTFFPEIQFPKPIHRNNSNRK